MDLTWDDVHSRAWHLNEALIRDFEGALENVINIYPIPSAGIHAAQKILEVTKHRSYFNLVEDPKEADIYVDDIIDSGNTVRNLYNTFGVKPTYALVDKHKESISGWVSFPWDRMKNHNGPEDNIKRILQYIGEDPEREGLKETPARVVRSYGDLFSGYQYKTDEDLERLIKIFEDGACDEMVVLKDIEFISMCEHHMLPFVGVAHIAYIPDGRIVGVSKLARILDVFSRRLQVQERLTQQITQTLDKFLQPKGSACIIEAKHECMTCRGVMKQQSLLVTSSLTGAFRDLAVRQELMSLIK